MDTFSRKERSWIMARVKSAGNRSTEMKLIGQFRRAGIKGWRRSYPLFGRPDFVFPKQRLAVFVDGCFWHGHPSKCRMPQANRAYWERKIARNVARDRLVSRALRARGWRVVRIWEDKVGRASVVRRVREALS